MQQIIKLTIPNAYGSHPTKGNPGPKILPSLPPFLNIEYEYADEG